MLIVLPCNALFLNTVLYGNTFSFDVSNTKFELCITDLRSIGGKTVQLNKVEFTPQLITRVTFQIDKKSYQFVL